MKRTMLLSISLCLGMTAMAQSTIKVSQISNGGEPMIFLPHIGCSSEMWEEIAEYYENEYACYLIDLAGFNGINPIDSSYTENFVKDIQAFLYNNQLDNAILLGQNYGAFLGVKVAQNKQLKVKAIIASDFYPNLSMVLDTAMTKEKLR